MKPLIFILLLFICISSFGQMTVNDIQDKRIKERIKFVKSKTDFFLLNKFSKSVKRKFSFAFTSCGFFIGEMRENYQFLNSNKFEPLDINNLTHNYSFIDTAINLKVDIDTYFEQYKIIEIRFQKISDSLKFISLDKIYNKGFLQKVKRKIAEVKLKQYYIEIDIDEKQKTFNIILKDKLLSHKYFIY
jgi:hypothetical protein